MKTTIAGLSLIVAAAFGVAAAVPTPALAADRTVNLTLGCGTGCTGTWIWYQGGTQLGSGSISGFNGITDTRGTTVQPATADNVVIGLSTGGAKGCGAIRGDSFSPGSPINVSLKINSQPNAYHNGCHASFSMKSRPRPGTGPAPSRCQTGLPAIALVVSAVTRSVRSPAQSRRTGHT